jgi:hypothetical protein
MLSLPQPGGLQSPRRPEIQDIFTAYNVGIVSAPDPAGWIHHAGLAGSQVGKSGVCSKLHLSVTASELREQEGVSTDPHRRQLGRSDGPSPPTSSSLGESQPRVEFQIRVRRHLYAAFPYANLQQPEALGVWRKILCEYSVSSPERYQRQISRCGAVEWVFAWLMADGISPEGRRGVAGLEAGRSGPEVQGTSQVPGTNPGRFWRTPRGLSATSCSGFPTPISRCCAAASTPSRASGPGSSPRIFWVVLRC